MRIHTLTLLAIFSLTCRGTNTTFHWTSPSHTPTTSHAHGNVGDYVAAGLGLSAHETHSTSAIATYVDDDAPSKLDASNEMSSALPTTEDDGRTQSSTTALIMTTDAANRGPGQSRIIANSTTSINDTLALDCWDRWLDYWSLSSLNQVSYPTGIWGDPTVETRTRTATAQTLIPTSTWHSWVYTQTGYELVTFSSDGYPVSVSASYFTSTFSKVEWSDITIRSSLSEYLTTVVTETSSYTWITTTRSTTDLPTPSCTLPAIVPECNKQWSSWINGDLGDNGYFHALGSFRGTPDCTQASITSDLCTSMASLYFSFETAFGQAHDVGWVTANSTSYFPASKSLAPGCSLGCQACSITGDTVQLYYWPPSTATLVEDGTKTATLTPFADNGSSIRTVSIEGKSSATVRGSHVLLLTYI